MVSSKEKKFVKGATFDELYAILCLIENLEIYYLKIY